MIFVEALVLTKLLPKYLSDDEYRDLLAHPEAGDIVRGSDGVRKIRWAQERETGWRLCV